MQERRILEVERAILDAVTKNGNLVEVSLAHAGFSHGGEIENLLCVVAHQAGAENVCGERVRAGNRNARVNRSATGWAVAFHPGEAVDDCQIGKYVLRHVEHVEVNDVVGFAVRTHVHVRLVAHLVVVDRRAQQHVLERKVTEA